MKKKRKKRNQISCVLGCKKYSLKYLSINVNGPMCSWKVRWKYTSWEAKNRRNIVFSQKSRGTVKRWPCKKNINWRCDIDSKLEFFSSLKDRRLTSNLGSKCYFTEKKNIFIFISVKFFCKFFSPKMSQDNSITTPWSLIKILKTQ